MHPPSLYEDFTTAPELHQHCDEAISIIVASSLSSLERSFGAWRRGSFENGHGPTILRRNRFLLHVPPMQRLTIIVIPVEKNMEDHRMTNYTPQFTTKRLHSMMQIIRNKGTQRKKRQSQERITDDSVSTTTKNTIPLTTVKLALDIPLLLQSENAISCSPPKMSEILVSLMELLHLLQQ